MGSPESEPLRRDETQHRRRIGRSFAVAAKAVTVTPWREFAKGTAPGVSTIDGSSYTFEETCPIDWTDWFERSKYCRWLSEKEGVAERQMGWPDASASPPHGNAVTGRGIPRPAAVVAAGCFSGGR